MPHVRAAKVEPVYSLVTMHQPPAMPSWLTLKLTN
jgi:hypothetical protein